MSDPSRTAHVLERLARHQAAQDHIGRSLCSTAAEVVEVTGAALMVVDEAGTVHPVGVHGQVMEAVEDLQQVHGEGPCIDAHQIGAPVGEPDLAFPSAPRWIGFTPLAVEAGARAMFGFPLRIGATCIGALNLCAERPGELTATQHRDALVLADVAITTLLATGPDGTPGGLVWPRDEDSGQLVVHQATGMVAVQVGTDLDGALTRLRAHAFLTGRRLSAIAQDVVARRLRLEA